MAARRRVALLVNPGASRVDEEGIASVRDVLSAAVVLEVMVTQRQLDGIRLAKAVSSDSTFDALVVYSGDGGFNEALNGLTRQLPIGFIPGGRTNVLPRALGVPNDPVRAARQVVEAIARDRMRPISLGRANGRRFGFSAGIGVDAELVRAWDKLGHRPDGRRPGDLAFMFAAARLLARKRWRIRPMMEVGGLGRAASVFVANGDPYSYVGRLPLHVAPEARFELGLDLVAPREIRPRAIPRLLAYALLGRGQTRAGDIIYRHDRDEFLVTCDAATALQVDGEDLGDVSEVAFEVERRAVNVLV